MHTSWQEHLPTTHPICKNRATRSGKCAPAHPHNPSQPKLRCLSPRHAKPSRPASPIPAPPHNVKSPPPASWNPHCFLILYGSCYRFDQLAHKSIIHFKALKILKRYESTEIRPPLVQISCKILLYIAISRLE